MAKAFGITPLETDKIEMVTIEAMLYFNNLRAREEPEEMKRQSRR